MIEQSLTMIPGPTPVHANILGALGKAVTPGAAVAAASSFLP